MKLSELLQEGLVVLPLEAGDKWQAIESLCARAAEVSGWSAARREAVHQALVVRERSMTTGMENGIAIPHAAVDGLPDVIAVLGLARDGVPFDALDDLPARIVVCLVIPRDRKLLHIRTLAEIAKLLSRPAVRVRLLDCGSAEDALAVIRDEEAAVGR